MNLLPVPVQTRWLCLCGLGLAVCLGGRNLSAQESSAQLPTVPTLHIYANLVQIPVLVLTSAQERLPARIASNRFSMSFDGGPWFKPTEARQEGDDPIDLAIVLDTRSSQADLMPKIDRAIAGLAPGFLHTHDRVSIYAIDCSAMSPVENVAADPVDLKNGVELALARRTERIRNTPKSPCNADTHLWDFLAYVTNKLSMQPGRRAILAVTDGEDRASKRSLANLTQMAQIGGVAIFGLAHAWESPRGAKSTEDTLSAACEQSGGLMMSLSGSSVAQQMQRLVRMLRERYILEFPRPSNAQAGKRAISIKIDRMDAFIRPAGDGVPVADRAVEDDAGTVHIDSPDTPQPEEHRTEPMPPESIPSPGRGQMN